MMNEFIAIEIACKPEFVQILIAELAELSFDTFEEHENGLATYTTYDKFDETGFNAVIDKYKPAANIQITRANVEKQNWNEAWETSYKPIVIDDKCLVRASFHPPQPQYPYEIVINPKMSFGTGHHETTYLMLVAQMQLNHDNKRVLDAGCGTGILSIMAGKMGADEIIAFDQDEWVMDNVKENLLLNKQQAQVLCGTISELGLKKPFDIVLANINKNVLMHDMSAFAVNLYPGADLLLSGFYHDDLEDINKKASDCGLQFIASYEKNSWVLAHFKKNLD
jgi:ribosomal protein L11 methyltransferase